MPLWKEVLDFFKKFSDLIVSAGSLIGICYYGTQLFRMQTKLAIPIIITCCSIILWIVCCIISRKNLSAKINRIVKLGLYAIPLLCLSTIIIWSLWPSKIKILVAKFECHGEKECPGINKIYHELDNETNEYKDVKAIRLDNVIENNDEAEKYARLYDANIVIWGQSERTKEMAEITVYYKILKKPEILKKIQPKEKAIKLPGTLKEADHLKLSQKASKKVNNLVMFTIGLAKMESKDYKTAIICLTRSIEIAGSEGIFPQTEILFRRGNAFAFIGKIDEAIKDYKQVIKRVPNGLMMKALYNTGIMFAAKNEYDKAIDSYTKALMIEKDFQIYTNRGVIYFYKNQFDLAIKDFTEAIKINQKNPIIFSNRAESYFRKGNLKEALHDCNIAIGLDKNYEGSYVNRAMVFNSMKKYKEAIIDCDIAIELNDKCSEAYLQRGIAYYRIGDKEESKKDIDMALYLAKNEKEKENIMKEVQRLNNK